MYDAGYHIVQLLLQHIERSLRGITLHGGLLRLRQCPLIHLLVLVQRYAVYLHRRGRHHVRRLLIHDKGVQRLDVHLAVAHYVGSYILSPALFVKGLHGDILDAGVLAYDALHLLQLYAEAADLHLSVPAAHKLYVAIGQIAHYVAGAVTASK